MKNIKKVGILGVGFMGGSLALALKKKFPDACVWGYARNDNSYRRLKKLGILDKVARDLKTVVNDADIVVLALPVREIVNYFRKIVPFLKKGSVVIDLGSSKETIEIQVRKYLPKDIDFVGCHPLCGSEKSGAGFSRHDLYKRALCVITSSPNKVATKKVKRFWEKLGSKVIFLSATEHDKIISSMSHLPHLVSFSFIESIPDHYLKFATRSFKDLTRIAESPAKVWADIFISNKNNILRDLKRLNKTLARFQVLLSKSDSKEIIRLIERVNLKRKNIL